MSYIKHLGSSYPANRLIRVNAPRLLLVPRGGECRGSTAGPGNPRAGITAHHRGPPAVFAYSPRARLHRLKPWGNNRYEVIDPPVAFKRGEIFEYEGELPKSLVESVASCTAPEQPFPLIEPDLPAEPIEGTPDDGVPEMPASGENRPRRKPVARRSPPGLGGKGRGNPAPTKPPQWPSPRTPFFSTADFAVTATFGAQTAQVILDTPDQ